MSGIFNNNSYVFGLLAIILIHLVILSKLIFFPYPELFIYPYLTNHGLLPYSQIMDQHFPGLMFLPINLNNLGMTSGEIAKYWSMGIVVIIHFLIFLISYNFFKSTWKVLVANVLFLVWQPFYEGWVLWIDNFLPLLLLLSFYLFLKLERTKQPKLVMITNGLVLGMAIVFKQTMIPLAGLLVIYSYWLRKNLLITAWLVLGLMTPPLLVFLYFFRLGVFGDFWYWTIVFNLTTYAQSGTKIHPSAAFISRVIVIYAFSLLGVFSKSRSRVVLLVIFLIGSIIGVFERTDFVHLQPSLPFMVILTTLGFASLRKRLVIGLTVLYLVIAGWWLRTFYIGHFSDRIMFFNDGTEKIAEAVKKYTKPNEKIFIFGIPPHLYQMTDTLPAGDVFVFQFPWFYSIAQNKILDGIKKDQPSIIVADRSVVIEGNPLINFASKTDRYIQENYQKVETIGPIEILQKKPNLGF